MRLSEADYRQLLGVARRYRLAGTEAEDILHEALLDAVQAGRHEAGRMENRHWLAGVIRNKARMAARGNRRRILRDTAWSDQAQPQSAIPSDMSELPAALSDLPQSLRALAALALSGHNRREIAYLLGIEDTALRQRVSQLKSRMVRAGIALPGDLPGLGLDLAYGRIRDALLPLLLRQRGTLASHDPDGHLFVVRRSQKP